MQPHEYYPRDLLTVARNQSEWTLGVQRELLAEITARPGDFHGIPSFFGLIFPALVIADCDDEASFETLQGLCKLSEADFLPLWGGMSAREWGLCLYRTCGENVAVFREILRDQQTAPWFRGAAAEALIWAVADGLISREEVLAILATFFTGLEAAANSAFWTGIGIALHRLCPEEVMETVSAAYVLGLIDREKLWPGAFEAIISKGKTHVIQQLEEELDKEFEQGIHAKISQWSVWKTHRKARGRALQAKKKRRKR